MRGYFSHIILMIKYSKIDKNIRKKPKCCFCNCLNRKHLYDAIQLLSWLYVSAATCDVTIADRICIINLMNLILIKIAVDFLKKKFDKFVNIHVVVIGREYRFLSPV